MDREPVNVLQNHLSVDYLRMQQKNEEMKSSDREPKMYNSQSQPSNILAYAFTSL